MQPRQSRADRRKCPLQILQVGRVWQVLIRQSDFEWLRYRIGHPAARAGAENAQQVRMLKETGLKKAIYSDIRDFTLVALEQPAEHCPGLIARLARLKNCTIP